MSPRHKKLPSGVLLLLLMVPFFLVTGGTAHAQTAGPTRNFQMSLWESGSNSLPITRADTDIRSFYYGEEPQPAGRSIIVGWGYGFSLLGTEIDWSRIVAVEFDEAYAQYDGNLGTCSQPTPGIATVHSMLQQRATELNDLNPKARFWVNFTSTEANWMLLCKSTQVFNGTYIDVLSDDDYTNGLDLNWYTLAMESPANPSQQVAYIPGVFGSPSGQYSLLENYFTYANAYNRVCILPLGSRGFTGISDGCPIWIVMGWLTGDTTSSGTNYSGMLDGSSGSEQIRAVWDAEVAYPVVNPTAATWLQPILQVLLQ